MKEKLRAFLALEGYAPISSNLPEFEVYLKKEYRHVTVLFVMELENNSTCTIERYQSVRDSARELLKKNGLENMHILTLIISDNVQHALGISSRDKYAWVIERQEKKLLIADDKVVDFYGMKRMLERFLADTEDAVKRIKAIEEEVIDTIIAKNEKQKSYVPWIAIALVALNIVIFILCTMTGELLYNIGDLNALSVLKNGQWYRIITGMFLHANISHLFNNMLILYLLGNLIEKRLGRLQFFISYFVCGIIASVVSLVFKWQSGNEIGSVGASGAVYGMFGIALIMEIAFVNWKRINLYTIEKLVLVFAFLIISFYIDSQLAGVDYHAHVGGICTGFVIGMIWWFISRRQLKEKKHEN